MAVYLGYLTDKLFAEQARFFASCLGGEAAQKRQ